MSGPTSTLAILFIRNELRQILFIPVYCTRAETGAETGTYHDTCMHSVHIGMNSGMKYTQIQYTDMHSSRKTYLHVSGLSVLKIQSDMHTIHLRGCLNTDKYIEICLNTCMYVCIRYGLCISDLYLDVSFAHPCGYLYVLFQLLHR
jgi:hypothetical protein